MKIIWKSVFCISLITFINPALAAWDSKCLRDCFATCHECNFCAYQCEVEYNGPPVTYPEQECPLNERDDNNDP